MEEGGSAVVVGGEFGEARVVGPNDWGEVRVGRGSEDGEGGLGLAQDGSVGRADVVKVSEGTGSLSLTDTLASGREELGLSHATVEFL